MLIVPVSIQHIGDHHVFQYPPAVGMERMSQLAAAFLQGPLEYTPEFAVLFHDI
jgi:hypothetical protein